MPEDVTHITCPACAYDFRVPAGADLKALVCPHCDGEVPREAIKAEAEVIAELAPGFRPGQKIGNYVIEGLLGSGGMAVVFRGRQLSLNRPVAIKILPKELAKNRMFLARFESEASVLANLNHPNVVSVIDRGTDEETYFIVMEYVEGDTLRDRIQRKGRIDPQQICAISEQTLNALEYAHRRGIVHRDIKPGNIMINQDQVVKLADFGLAHLAKSRGGSDATRENQAMGTLKYMAPEQLTRPREVDGRADIYSFGVCLYEMLTGQLPLGMFKMPSEFDPSLDIRWDDIILRSLKMDPEERYQSAEEMTRAIHEVATTPRMTLTQREEEEEARAGEKPGVSRTGCPKCRHESPPDARVCEKCGESLSDLFEKCPSCGKENRLDVSQCPACNADLDGHRDTLRTMAESIQTEAKKLIAEKRYDAAMAQLKKLLGFRAREYAAIRARAELWIERMQRRRERFLLGTYEAGQRMIVEGRAERALQLWEALPENYKDVGTRRKEIAGRQAEAVAAREDASRLLKSGDLAGAVGAWEKAVAFWPQDPELRKRLMRARIQLGNQNLKRGYIEETQEAVARGNLVEAAALCHRAIELDPNDPTALSLLKQVESAEAEVAADEAGALPTVRVAQRRRQKRPKPANRVAIGLVLTGIGAVVIAGLAFFVYIPSVQRDRAQRAAALLSEAAGLKTNGKFEDAIRRCDRVEKEFPKTAAAANAAEMAQEMRRLLIASRSARNALDEMADKGDLASLVAAFKRYNEAVTVPPISVIESERRYAMERIEDIRGKIAGRLAEHAAAHESKGEWRDSLADYRAAADQFGVQGEPIASKLDVARRRVEGCDAMVARARQEAKGGRWNEAAKACTAALDFVPTDTPANQSLATIAPHLTPPEGMTFVPPGEYVVGGSGGNARRAVVIPHGFFIDLDEVSNERYLQFVRATGHAMPPDWGGDRKPQPGTESLPVVNVTWEEAAAFATWAGCVLPAEEQWECAARGKTAQVYPWGDRWDPAAAVLGFDAAPVASQVKDRSLFGCLNMAGNVAEWTATQGAPSPAAAPSPGSRRDLPPPGQPPEWAPPAVPYVVKGSSWAGLERDRPTVVVPGRAEGGDRPQVILTPDPAAPEVPVRFRSNIAINYLGAGVAGASEGAFVLIKRWMAGWGDQWAEMRYTLTPGETIGGRRNVVVELGGGDKGDRRTEVVDFSTGCVVERQESGKWLEVRTPSGALLRLPIVAPVPSRQPKVASIREPPAGPAGSAEKAAMAASRMFGRPGGRYLNVGFRCVKLIWSPKPETPATPSPAVH